MVATMAAASASTEFFIFIILNLVLLEARNGEILNPSRP
ncbi:hypothetical protein RHIZ404_200536 [Rhizobium sp. EC-SD404]|nr:hypothetical protein RHIZ404_200536 [Rhizobium sp. EC-SD404]